MSAAVTVDHVSMRFRQHTALDGVSTTIEENSITGLLGRNGAGKTTLLQVLTGHRLATSGRVRVLGSAPYENDAVLQQLCFIREGQRYPDHFRVKDAVRAAATLFPRWDDDLAASLLRDFELPEKRAIKKLSRGMNSAVGIVIGLASRAPISLFDEPYLGLDAVARQLFYDRLLADYAEHPRTVVISTHLIEEISGLLEHVVLLDRGRVVLDGEVDSFRAAALTVTGPTAEVMAFAGANELLQAEHLGGHTRAVVRVRAADARDTATATGLATETTSLQEFVVALSRRAAEAPAARSTQRLQEASR